MSVKKSVTLSHDFQHKKVVFGTKKLSLYPDCLSDQCHCKPIGPVITQKTSLKHLLNQQVGQFHPRHASRVNQSLQNVRVKKANG